MAEAEPQPGGGPPGSDRAAADGSMVLATLRGEHEAFVRLYDRYQAGLLGFFCRKMNELGAAEDLVQETFLRAYRSLNTCRNPAAFEAWLYGIARNCLREWFHGRRRQERAQAAVLGASAPLPFEPSTAADLEAARLAAAVSSLPRRMQEIIRLKYERGLTCEEIAARTGKPLGSVRSWLVRAQHLLRTILLAGERKP